MEAREINQLKDKVEDLELQLDQHFRELNAAVEQRDKFVLSATWGIVKGATSIAAFIGVPIALKNWLGWDGWWLGIAGFFGAMIVLIAMSGWHEKGHADDEKKMWRLPEWQRWS